MSGLFITATGTGVGKTLLTAALAHQLAARGETPTVLKPLISGYQAGDADSDTAVLLSAAGIAATPQTVERTSPWRFSAPLSPDMAAAAEGRSIDVDALIAHSREALAGPGPVLIEGVGGAFVPLGADRLVADWMGAIDCPAVLVAGSYLGTLSHTIATVEALAARKIAPVAVVVSESRTQPVELAVTVAALQGRLPVPVFALPRLEGPAPWRHAPDFAELLGSF